MKQQRMLIERTNPEQGKKVIARFIDLERSRKLLGALEVEFDLWLQFEKLLKEGQELRKVREPGEQRIMVEFRVMEVKP